MAALKVDLVNFSKTKGNTLMLNFVTYTVRGILYAGNVSFEVSADCIPSAGTLNVTRKNRSWSSFY